MTALLTIKELNAKLIRLKRIDDISRPKLLYQKNRLDSSGARYHELCSILSGILNTRNNCNYWGEITTGDQSIDAHASHSECVDFYVLCLDRAREFLTDVVKGQ